MVVHSRDLARTSVFLDYDGTVASGDVGIHLLERLADPSWRRIEEQYVRGEIGSRECQVAQWTMLSHIGEATLRAVAAEVRTDPDVGPLVSGLRSRGAEVAVVSDGFGFYIRDALADIGLADVPVLTNSPDFATGRLDFPNEDRCCPCTSCGTCKQAPIRDAHDRGRVTVLVGDGASDRKAALLADHVFAKNPLARWCGEADVPFVAVSSLADVRFELLGE